MLWTGCQWKALPKDLPPKSTVHDYLELWNLRGTKMAMTVWRTGAWSLQIVKRDRKSLESRRRPKRWIVERTFVRWIQSFRPSPRLAERRTLRNDRCCIHPSRHDPHHAQATCCKCLAINPNFPDGL